MLKFFTYIFAIIISLVFNDPLYATSSILDDEEQRVSYGTNDSSNVEYAERTDIQDKYIKNDKCHHWGLQRWFCGIGEFFQRAFCCDYLGCMETADKDRQYLIYRARDDKENYNQKYLQSSSDCYLISSTESGPSDVRCVPCLIIPCAPILLLSHICCLPCSICKPREDHEKINYIPKLPIIHIPREEPKGKWVQKYTNDILANHNSSGKNDYQLVWVAD